MNKIILFTDASVNNQSNIGYGAYLAISEFGLDPQLLKPRVKVKRFSHTSSTKLELQTVLWALDDVQVVGRQVIVYTDSQNILGLEKRRDRLEKNNYRSKKNKRLDNYKLYIEFFERTDPLDCQFIKVCGHQPSKNKDEIHKLFALVDKASRHALRRDNVTLNETAPR